MDVADRHITICTLNDVLGREYQVRFLMFPHGNDTLGLAAFSVAEWRELQRADPDTVAESFIDPRPLPNLLTELTDEKPAASARARFGRMLDRYKVG